MPEKKSNIMCVEDLRHAEYYEMQNVFDELYKRSIDNEEFTDLMEFILSKENILLAYRNIKNNKGSKTPGVDKITIKDIGKMPPDELVDKIRYFMTGSPHGYRPKPVRRKDIPKPNGKTRPLGIPCMYDRLIQQCIKQVLEPICEAKFSESSYGFRPDRSIENTMARTYQYLQQSKLYYVIEIDIKSFFDEVNHSKLIKQLWSFGIRDKNLIYIIKQILKSPVKMQNGLTMIQQKGVQQGGILSPLFANISLNEFDHWISSQWQEHPVTEKYHISYHANGSKNVGTGYRAMRKTNLKEMYMIRYADDIRIFCRNYDDAIRIKFAVQKWLSERLKLELSGEKTKIVNVKHEWMNFLGFKIKVRKKGNKWIVISRMSDEQHNKEKVKLKQQLKHIALPRKGRTERDEIGLYNSQVLGIQNYYQYATDINNNVEDIQWQISVISNNRLRTEKGCRLKKAGRELTDYEKKRFRGTKMMRYVAGSDEPLYPIGYVQHKNPMNKKLQAVRYTEDGRKYIHKNLTLNTKLLSDLMKKQQYNTSTEMMDNKIAKFCSQQGKCAVLGTEFTNTENIHCHHIVPKYLGGTDDYDNLILIDNDIHKLVHAKDLQYIKKTKKALHLTKKQIEKVNSLRLKANDNKL